MYRAIFIPIFIYVITKLFDIFWDLVSARWLVFAFTNRYACWPPNACKSIQTINRAPRFFSVFRCSGPVWRREACRKRLAGMFGSVIRGRSAGSWRVSALSARAFRPGSRRARVQAAQLRQPSHVVGKVLHPDLRFRAHQSDGAHQRAPHVVGLRAEDMLDPGAHG